MQTQYSLKTRVTRTGNRKQYGQVVLPKSWIEFCEERLGTKLEQVEMYVDGDDLVIRCPK